VAKVGSCSSCRGPESTDDLPRFLSQTAPKTGRPWTQDQCAMLWCLLISHLSLVPKTLLADKSNTRLMAKQSQKLILDE